MNFPVYNASDLHNAMQDGNHELLEFTEFLSQLSEQEILDNTTEKGILAFVQSKGTEELSTNQAKVLDIILARYDNQECKLCGEKIPLNEVLFLDENDGFCSYHKHMMDKE